MSTIIIRSGVKAEQCSKEKRCVQPHFSFTLPSIAPSRLILTRLVQKDNSEKVRASFCYLVLFLCRFWMTQRRCEMTLQHLPATPFDKLPLFLYPDHPLNKISRHRMFIKLHKHTNIILVSVLFDFRIVVILLFINELNMINKSTL